MQDKDDFYPIFNDKQLQSLCDNGGDCTFPYYTYDHVEAAMCLWEECLHQRTMGNNVLWDWLRGNEGAANARDMCINFAKDIEKSYRVARDCGFDDSFDWEFVPRWAALAMEITQDHFIQAPWLDYMGRRIYYDWKDAMSHLGRTSDS